jgi:uncharacterized membrane protein
MHDLGSRPANCPHPRPGLTKLHFRLLTARISDSGPPAVDSTMSKLQNNESVVPGAMQFSTRTLLAGIGACAVLILVMQQMGAVWSTALIWILLLIAAHVAANVRGSRLSSEHDAIRSQPEISDSYAPGPAIQFAPATQLRDNRRFGRALLAVTSVMAAAGLLLGTAALILLTSVDAGGIILGGVSAGVLGGLLGFVCASFAMVATGAFQEAADEQRCSRARPTGNTP